MATHSDTNVTAFQSRTVDRELNSRREAGNAPESEQEYRQRMRANWLSAVVVAVLLVVGEWALNGLVDAQQQSLGCVHAAGGGCSIIETPIAPPSVGQWS
jgi:hypothetical protein